jgi:hypothetical protein
LGVLITGFAVGITVGALSLVPGGLGVQELPWQVFIPYWVCLSRRRYSMLVFLELFATLSLLS